MTSPLKSLALAIALLMLGGLLLAPYTATKRRGASDGTVTQMTARERQLAELRVNWFSYACFLGAAAASA